MIYGDVIENMILNRYKLSKKDLIVLVEELRHRALVDFNDLSLKNMKLKRQIEIAKAVLWSVYDGRDDKEYLSDIASVALDEIMELEK